MKVMMKMATMASAGAGCGAGCCCAGCLWLGLKEFGDSPYRQVKMTYGCNHMSGTTWMAKTPGPDGKGISGAFWQVKELPALYPTQYMRSVSVMAKNETAALLNMIVLPHPHTENEKFKKIMGDRRIRMLPHSREDNWGMGWSEAYEMGNFEITPHESCQIQVRGNDVSGAPKVPEQQYMRFYPKGEVPDKTLPSSAIPQECVGCDAAEKEADEMEKAMLETQAAKEEIAALNQRIEDLRAFDLRT